MDCPKCTKKFANKLKLDKHVFNVHDFPKPNESKGRISCDKCQRSFNAYKGLLAHIASTHERVWYYCNTCNAAFKNKRVLDKHENRAHKQIEYIMNFESYECEHCGKVFKTKRQVRMHLGNVHVNGLFECICKKTFSNKNYLDSHIRYVHANIKPISITCGHCDRIFRSKYLYKLHVEQLLSNNISGVYICEHCDKIFKKTKQIREHVWLSHGNKKFPCKQCRKKYRTKQGLKCHVEYRHSANSLQVQFLANCKKNGYKNEMRCEKCLQTFNTEYLLWKHVNKFHTYVTCKKCYETYKQSHARRDLTEVHEDFCEKCLGEDNSVKIIQNVANFDATVKIKSEPYTLEIIYEPSIKEEIESEPDEASSELSIDVIKKVEWKTEVKFEEDDDIDIGPVVFLRESEPIIENIQTFVE